MVVRPYRLERDNILVNDGSIVATSLIHVPFFLFLLFSLSLRYVFYRQVNL